MHQRQQQKKVVDSREGWCLPFIPQRCLLHTHTIKRKQQERKKMSDTAAWLVLLRINSVDVQNG
jgi:hypothetical protein